MTSRRDIIADTLKTELGSQVRVGLSGLDALDLDTLATAIDRAIERGDNAPPDEGTPPQSLSSANDG